MRVTCGDVLGYFILIDGSVSIQCLDCGDPDEA